MESVIGMKRVTANGMSVQVMQATPNAEQLVWLCAHQDVTPHFAVTDSVPSTYGSVVERLLSRGHFGPFEHPSLSVNIGGVSRALMAQITRHRIGVTFDIQSLRYTKIDATEADATSFVFPPRSSGFSQDSNLEGSDTASQRPDDIYKKAYTHALLAYRSLLNVGVPSEDARFVLPIGLKVNLTMSINARSLMHFLDMRLSKHAQWEIRELAECLLEVGKKWMPSTFSWYEENRAKKAATSP